VLTKQSGTLPKSEKKIWLKKSYKSNLIGLEKIFLRKMIYYF